MLKIEQNEIVSRWKDSTISGRTNLYHIQTGHTLDFWRVLYVNKNEKKLLLFAEMKLPGEAWLDFQLMNGILIQIATFRPKGLLGRAYRYLVFPLHGLRFKGLINELTKHYTLTEIIK